MTEVDLQNVRILVVEDELDALDLMTIDLDGARREGAVALRRRRRRSSCYARTSLIC